MARVGCHTSMFLFQRRQHRSEVTALVSRSRTQLLSLYLAEEAVT